MVAQSADVLRIRKAIARGWVMRTGRTLGRTLYLRSPSEDDADICVGIVDDYALAEEIVRRWNKET